MFLARALNTAILFILKTLLVQVAHFGYLSRRDIIATVFNRVEPEKDDLRDKQADLCTIKVCLHV